MSYLVLARKYRPRSFLEMVGQEHVVQALTNALNTQRLHHAYMFTGTRGVGKTTVSRILAKSLNCTGPDGHGQVTAEPCGVCQACTEIDAGRFVDYIELDAASNRGVDEVQGLLEQAVYKPVQGRFKVFMIDEVHMLTNTAFNAMLKTLEEPPEYLKFVLATTDPQKVPVTVLSRCLQFNLRPMVPETVFAHLEHVLGSEGIAAEPGALHLLARAARGSMRDALSLTDQAIAFSGGQGGDGGLRTESIRQMLGSVDAGYVHRMVEALALAQPAQLLELVKALQTHGLSAANALEDMTQILQRMAVYQMVPDAAGQPHPDEEEIRRLAALMPVDETQLLYSICLQGGQELGLAPDEYAALVMVLLRLLAFKPAVASAEKKTLKAPEQAAAPAAAPAGVAPATVAPAEQQAQMTTGVEQAGPGDQPVAQAVPTGTARVAAPEKTVVAVPPEPVAVPDAEAVVADMQPAGEPQAGIPPWEDIPPAVPGAEIAVAPVQEAATVPVEPAPEQAADAAPAASSIAPPAAEALVRLPVVSMTAPRAEPAAPADSRISEARRLLPTEYGDLWSQLAGQIVQQGLVTAFTRELLLQSQLLEQTQNDGGQALWTLRVESETLQHEPSRKRLEQALADIGYPVLLQVSLGRVVDSPAMRTSQAREEQRLHAEQLFGSHPFVQQMVQQLDAQIVPDSVQLLESVVPDPEGPAA